MTPTNVNHNNDRCRRTAPTYRICALAAFALALGLSWSTPSTAHAQYAPKDRKVVVRAQVDSWAPKEGPVGTEVVIRGRFFSRGLKLLIGGYSVRPTLQRTSEIRFRIPENSGDGRIVLRSPKHPDDIVIGTFRAWTDPKITGFSPSSGVAGTRVAIQGQHFSQNDKVWLGQTPLAIESYRPSTIVVTIPAGAQTGYFTLQNSRNHTTKSSRNFRVVDPAPVVTNFSPQSGGPGTIVRLSGSYLGNDLKVRYGRLPVEVTRSAPTWIDVRVPERARRSDSFSIYSPRGRVSTNRNFQLVLAPTVRSLSPSWGAAGTRVALRGDNFSGADKVYLGGKECRRISVTDRQLTVEVPAGAQAGPFLLYRNGTEVARSSVFQVSYAPVLSNVQPLRGAPGTTVTLTGQYLDDATVYYGGRRLSPSVATPGRIVVTIPNSARNENFTVKNRAGEATWQRPFEVWHLPSIARVAPNRASPGDSVTLIGKNLDQAEGYYLGNVALPVVLTQSGRRVVVKVPQGATSDFITIKSYGQMQRSNERIDVLAGLSLDSFYPTQGFSGTEVRILGRGFDANTRVYYGNTQLRVDSYSATELKVVLPTIVNRSEVILVRNSHDTASFSQPFTYINAPVVRSFSPNRLRPGATLHIRGNHFAPTTRVKIGNQWAQVNKRQGNDDLWAVVPNLAAGRYTVSVEMNGQERPARSQLDVEGWAQVTHVAPNRTKPGKKIMLKGSGLDRVRVYFGKLEMPIVKKRFNKLWLRVPARAKGTGPLTIVEGNHTSYTSQSLTVQAKSHYAY